METLPNPAVVPHFESSLPSAPPSLSIPVYDKTPETTRENARQTLNQKAFNELFGLIRRGAKDLLHCTSGRGDRTVGSVTGRDAFTPLTAEQILALLDESELEAMTEISNTIGHNLARIMFMADGRGDRAEHRSRSRLRRRLHYAGSSKHNKLTVFSTTSHRSHYPSSVAPPLPPNQSPAPPNPDEEDNNMDEEDNNMDEEDNNMDEDEDAEEPLPLRLQVMCHDCRAETTPRWRKGPDGPGTLCNVCGLLYAKRMRRLVYTERSFRRRGRRIR
ncbi:unnamed protein product [Clonostachys byssicola]|uniref:GATA-type domain-containing protein n=1 Tax=Clonostachys byssicola TaxID=160290 RepID=A0A9N9UTE9_9HYPO|nr:unnamed protein product [Clonostachys byssicola]